MVQLSNRESTCYSMVQTYSFHSTSLECPKFCLLSNSITWWPQSNSGHKYTVQGMGIIFGSLVRKLLPLGFLFVCHTVGDFASHKVKPICEFLFNLCDISHFQNDYVCCWLGLFKEFYAFSSWYECALWKVYRPTCICSI